MKVALLTDGIYPYQIGGMQKHSYYLCKYLAKNGILIDLYLPKMESETGFDLPDFSKEERKSVFPVFVTVPAIGSLPGHYIKESYQYSVSIWQAFQKRPKPDIVYIQGFSGWKLLLEFKKQKDHPATVLNFHGLEMFQKAASYKNWLEQILFRPFVLKNLKAADYVQSLGGNLTQILGRLGISKERIIELVIGIDREWVADDFKKKNSDISFVFIGRYERRKGIEELSEVLRELRGSFVFHFIGPIPTEKQIQASNIHYHGLLKDVEAIKLILQASDVLVCPSYAEGMPTVILEAMASGCAIIASDIGAVRIQVDKTNGWLIPPGDKKALGDTLQQVLNTSKERLQQKQKASIEKIKAHFLWGQVAMQTIYYFEQILNNANKV